MTGPVANTISQGILAKLLASENITVHVGNYTTAFFDVKNRVLGLPSWNVESKAVSDLLIGHEVGHALWTPVDGIENFKKEHPHIPFSILNIIEDIRIERMIQDRYPGLISSFNQGYEHFLKKDFFKILGKDISKMGFADRLNVKAKLRHLIHVPFTPEEQEIFDRALAADTFEEVISIVKDAYELVKGEPQPDEDSNDDAGSTEGNSADTVESSMIDPAPHEPSKEKSQTEKDSDSDKEESKEKQKKSPAKAKTESNDDKDSEDSKVDEDSDDADSKDDEDSDGEDESEDESKGKTSDIGSASDTDDSDVEETEEESNDSEIGSESGEDNTDKDSDADNHSAGGCKGSRTNKEIKGKKPKYKSADEELTSSTLDSLNDELSNLHTDFGNCRPIMFPSAAQLSRSVTPWQKVVAGRANRTKSYEEGFLYNERVKADWAKYKKNVKKHIQNLITDFERRKAAFQYSRAQISDAGDIDVNRLHAYKFDDQIFRSITKLADCKNHGMMFFIDYSGSMSEDIFNVLDHTLNLVMFCNAVGIPYQVFGFTNTNFTDPESIIRPADIPHNELSLDNASVFELLSSAMKPKELDLAMRQLRAQIFIGGPSRYCYGIPFASPWEAMSGTPLNETLIIAHDLVAKFRKKYHVQKMNVIVLSDGEGQGLRLGHDRENADFVKTPSIRENRLIGQLAGREIELTQFDSNRNYATLVNNLKTALGCTMIGFFITRRKKDLRLSCINSIRFSNKHGFTKTSQGDWATAAAMTERESHNFRKNRCMFISNGFNFDCYFLIDSRDARIHGDEDSFDSNINDEEFAGPISSAAQNKLAREFTKFTSDKKSSRIILNRFAEIIA